MDSDQYKKGFDFLVGENINNSGKLFKTVEFFNSLFESSHFSGCSD